MVEKPLFPLFLKLDGRKVLVIGAGTIALRKIEALIEYGAWVSVVSRDAHPDIQRMADEGRIHLEIGEFSAENVKENMLVVDATGDDDLSPRVVEACREYGVLLNTVDIPPACDFYMASRVSRGYLQIGISTSGASPALAKRLREHLERHFPAKWSDYLQLLSAARERIKKAIPNSQRVRSLAAEDLLRRTMRDMFDGSVPLDEENFERQLRALEKS